MHLVTIEKFDKADRSLLASINGLGHYNEALILYLHDRRCTKRIDWAAIATHLAILVLHVGSNLHIKKALNSNFQLV